MKKPHFLLIICCFLLVDMTTFSFLAPILPDLILSRHMSLSLIGCIFSFYPLSYFIVSVYLSKSLHLFQKKKLLIYCQILLVIANLLFGILDMISSNLLLVILSMLSRFVQGIAIGGGCSILYAYIPELYPREQEETFAIIEMSVGIGISLGPVLGGFLYKYLNYERSFLVISGFYAVISYILLSFMKNDTYKDLADCSLTFPNEMESSLNSDKSFAASTGEMGTMEIDQIQIGEEIQISYMKIFKNKTFFMTFFVYCVCYTSVTLIQPTFSDHIHSFGYDSDTVGMLFALSDFAYALASLALIKLFKYFQRKHLIIFGGCLTLISLLMLGPEEFTYLPKNIYVICVGMFINGISEVFYNATIIPEFIDILIDIYGYEKKINDLGSGMYNTGLAFSEFCGPLLGGILADFLGFGRGLTVYSIFLGFYLIIYGIFIRRPPRNGKFLDN